jgi:carbon monoxide dehydrogenase subunit G
MTSSKQMRKAGAAAAAAALALSVTTLLAAEKNPVAPGGAAPRVSVADAGNGAYRVEGSFGVDARPLVAWAVLTDYDNLSSFVSSMRSSSAARPEPTRLLVTQEAVGRAGPFSRALHVVLDVTEEPPGRLEFHDVCGASFRSYAGAWAIDPDGNGVRVTYTLQARPRSSPPFFARSILASNARGLLEQVRLEMLRRGRVAAER